MNKNKIKSDGYNNNNKFRIFEQKLKKTYTMYYYEWIDHVMNVVS